MGKPQYLIDSNTVIDYLNDKLLESGNRLLNEVVDQMPQVSVVTKIEVLGFNTKTEKAQQMLIDFIEVGFVYGLDDEVVNQTITLRKNYRMPSLLLLLSSMASLSSPAMPKILKIYKA